MSVAPSRLPPLYAADWLAPSIFLVISGIWVLDQKALRPKGFTALGQARRAMKAKL